MPTPSPDDFAVGVNRPRKEFSRDIGQDWNIRQVGVNLVGTYKPTGTNHILAFDGATTRTPIAISIFHRSAGAGSTTSTSFVDYPGPVEETIVKRITNSLLLVSGQVGMSNGSAGALAAIWGVRINSVDTQVGQFFFNLTSVHMQNYANQYVASGLAAGSYPMRVRWRTPGGGSINADSNDQVMLVITEIPL